MGFRAWVFSAQSPAHRTVTCCLYCLATDCNIDSYQLRLAIGLGSCACLQSKAAPAAADYASASRSTPSTTPGSCTDTRCLFGLPSAVYRPAAGPRDDRSQGARPALPPGQQLHCACWACPAQCTGQHLLDLAIVTTCLKVLAQHCRSQLLYDCECRTSIKPDVSVAMPAPYSSVPCRTCIPHCAGHASLTVAWLLTTHAFRSPR